MRTLLFMPGGLELHIGVSQEALHVHRCPLVHLHCPCRDAKICVLCLCATTPFVPGTACSTHQAAITAYIDLAYTGSLLMAQQHSMIHTFRNIQGTDM